MDLETSETGIKCVHCGRNCSDEDKFLTHIKTHLFENGFYYPCLAGCPKRFKNLKTYKQHKKNANQFKIQKPRQKQHRDYIGNAKTALNK